MKAIKENIVGLFRFGVALSALVRPFNPVKPPERDGLKQREDDKYMNILKQPTTPLIPSEPVFCPKCHVLACHIAQTAKGIQVIRNGVVQMTIEGNMTTKDGKEVKGFPIRCPNGHSVRIE